MGKHRKYPSGAGKNGSGTSWYRSVLEYFRHSRAGRNLSLVLAGVVVFATTYSLILPALTLEEDSLAEMPGLHLGQKAEVVEILDCPKEEHTHTDACLPAEGEDGNVVCGQEEHAHSGDCYHEEVIWVDQDANEKEIEEAAEEAGGVLADAVRDPEEDSLEQLPEKASGSAEAVEDSGESAAGSGRWIFQDVEETPADTDAADREAVTDADDAQTDATESPVTEGEETEDAADTREEIRQDGSAQENPEMSDEKTMDPAVAEETAPGEWTYRGKDYQVHVMASTEAKLPAGAQLSVQEISRGSVQYLAYTAIAKDRLSDPDAEIVNRRFFDICFLADGKKVEPDTGVTVEITFDEVKDVREEQKLNVVHFAEKKTELLENASSVTEEGQETIRFETGSFSIFGIVYTVDIHYEKDGQDYEFSIPGGGAMTLSEVVRLTGLADQYRKADSSGKKTEKITESRVPSGSPDRVFFSDIDDGSTAPSDENAPVEKEPQNDGNTSPEETSSETPEDTVDKKDSTEPESVEPEAVPDTENVSKPSSAEPSVEPAKEGAERNLLVQMLDRTIMPTLNEASGSAPAGPQGTDDHHPVSAPDSGDPAGHETQHETKKGEMSAGKEETSAQKEESVPSDTVPEPDSSTANGEEPVSGPVDEKASENPAPNPDAGNPSADAEETGTDEANERRIIKSGEDEDAVEEETAPVEETADSTEDTAFHQPEIRDFLDNIQKVEFSSPDLVWVGKAEDTVTVGQLKETNGLDVQYSAELTEEQIADINAQTVEAGDWALVSLKDFISDETLTITMKDGKVFRVKVTDAQIKKTVIDAKGDTWEITVTYGDDAQIPDGTELKVIEYSRDDLLFHECFSDREKWVEEVTNNSENNSQKGNASENSNNFVFEPGFGDAVNYDVDGDLSDEDKAQAVSFLQSSEAPVISGYILFDISLIYNGIEIEPLAPVQVMIQSTNPQLQEYDDISVGHFVEDTADISHEHSMETIDEISFSSDEGEANAPLTVDFKTSSFSLYDVTGIRWTANQSKTVYFALKTGINKVLDIDQNGTIPVFYSEIEDMDPSAVSAYIQSLTDYANAEPIIIYDKSGSDFYAIDGNGNLARVYESGDMVLWNGQPSIGWKLIRYLNDSGEYTGYYDFINMETGKFLTPQATQTISDNRIGIQLDGAAGHNSTIKAWDGSVNAYCGYSIQNNQLVTNESIEWFFASVSQTVSDDLKLQTVDTVDSTSLGITIKMFDYPSTGSTNNRTDFQRNFNIVDSQKRDWVSGGSVIQGLVKNTLNNEGFPVAIYKNTDLKGLFTGSNSVPSTNANHLFIKQTYEETGYFEYSSFENYAYLGSGTDFTVYRQIGAEDIAYTHSKKIYGNSTDYYFNRGNFLPYNSIADYKTATQKYQSSGVTNKYDEDGNRLSSQDPRNGEALFLTQESVDYFFGMSMEANFYQPVDGKNNKEDVIYEFNGDDDLWVFIDNVLVLDIGGCHHAHSGSINFSTGAVQVETGNGVVTTTIRKCFKDAGIFPDGTKWIESKANQYFSGNTFADYSQHNMKMFYMERGAGASNLHIKFNLPVIKDAGKLIVDKIVSGTVNEKYSNEKFPFQVIKVDGNTETRFTEAVYDSNGQPVEYAHEAVIDGKTYNDVFYLRPGEAAVFDVSDNTQQYYVRELGIDIRYYDRVLINREESNITNGVAESSVSSVKKRNRVTYDNHGVTEDLRIRKIVEGDEKNIEDTFEFYVYLTGPNNELIPYSNGDYYVLDPNGNYCTYVNGLPLGNIAITEATRTAYHSGQWGTIGSIPEGYTVLIPDLLVGTDFLVSERIDRMPAGYELKSIVVEDDTADTFNITEYTNVTAGDAGSIVIGNYSYSNHSEGKLKKDTASDATVIVTNKAANTLVVNKIWQTNDFVTVHGPVQFALYKLVNGDEVLVKNSVKTLIAPASTIEYQIEGNIDEYVIREVVVTTNDDGTTVTPVENNGVIEISGETTKLGSDKTDTYIVTYQQGEAVENSRTDTVTNEMPQLTVNKKDMTSGNQLADAEFRLTGDDGETALKGYESLKSDNKTSGNLLNSIYLSNGTYYLVETKTPDGYDMLTYKVKIVVSGVSSKIFTASAVPESITLIADQTPNDNMLYTFNVYNNPSYALPATGGPGTILMCLAGTVLAELSFFGMLLWLRRRKAR